MKPSKADIIAVANVAGVSPATVSRAINHPDLVKPSTRTRIREAIEQTGYIRNRAAQAIHGKRSGTIGLILPTVNNAIFAEVMQSFSDAVDAEGFTILIATHGFDLTREHNLLRKLMEHRVDGVALIGLDHAESTYRLLDQHNLPSIAVWNHATDSRISCIGVDNRRIGAIAAEHLLNLGHRRIGMVFPPTGDNDRARGRLQGAMQAITDAGATVDPNWNVTSLYSVSHAKAVCMKQLSQHDAPTAILCGNDVIAHGVLYGLSRQGLRVPEDVSVIGIGDFPGSAEIEPTLSTIRLPARTIGKRAGEQLVRMIADSNETTMVREVLEGIESIRASTGPPNHSRQNA
ncbi:MAG: LacI family DNA-binding transcriptional regulator [Pikeienuella sp.]